LPAAAAPLQAPSSVTSAAAVNAGAATVVEGRLQASPGGAEFAPALGAQLNVFLREGVQHARLHLNPAELGPLTVQIQLDGAAAQVRLAAEHPLTRQALEQAMPTLASTLRDSGLTLTGGGVFEQPANPQPQPDGRSSPGTRTTLPREGPDAAVHADGAPLRATVARRGVVDLVA
jgi:flagellar hook-length control protein FliK